MSTNTIPIAIRSHVKLDEILERRIRTQLARHLSTTTAVERATVRFEDANGPKGGIDIICRIKVVIAGRPSILVAKSAISVPVAFADAVHATGMALSRSTKKQQTTHSSSRAR